MERTRLLAAALALVACALVAAPAAHEIPRTVTMHLLVKAEGDRLNVLVRAPLSAMRDIQWPQRDGFLEVSAAEPALVDAVAQWILPDLHLFEEEVELSRPVLANVRVSLPSDRSFDSYENARRHIQDEPELPDSIRLPWDQALLDVWLAYPIRSDGSSFSIRPAFERLGVEVLTSLRFVHSEGVRAFELRGDPGLVRLDPRWHQAALHFINLGFFHILDGIDHLLFLACLVIPLRRLRPLVLVVTSFTAAHSVTLIASALDFAPDALWFPPLVEVLIAASIVYMALENVLATPSIARRCGMAFGFGLVHGFGFSFALKETLQFAGSHLLSSLVSFNVGVELGQLVVLAALVPAIHLLFRFAIAERMGIIVLSVIVAHTAWHWMTDRWSTFRAYELPPPDIQLLLALTRLLVVFAALAVLVLVVRGRRRGAGAIDSKTEQTVTVGAAKR